MNESLKKQLEGIYGKSRKHKKQHKDHKKVEERFTTEEIEVLMGVNRAIYTRKKGGAYKQK